MENLRIHLLLNLLYTLASLVPIAVLMLATIVDSRSTGRWHRTARFTGLAMAAAPGVIRICWGCINIALRPDSYFSAGGIMAPLAAVDAVGWLLFAGGYLGLVFDSNMADRQLRGVLARAEQRHDDPESPAGTAARQVSHERVFGPMLLGGVVGALVGLLVVTVIWVFGTLPADREGWQGLLMAWGGPVTVLAIIDLAGLGVVVGAITAAIRER